MAVVTYAALTASLLGAVGSQHSLQTTDAGAVATAASPQCNESLCSPRDLHAGLNLRTDFGTHPLRLDAGARFSMLDLYLVVDPMIWLDGQADLDAIADIALGRGWSIFGGFRSTSIGILDGRQWQQKSLTGAAARPPSFLQGRVRSQFGIELAVLWVKHGAGLPTDWISFESPRHWLDHVNFGMFVRFEYARTF